MGRERKRAAGAHAQLRKKKREKRSLRGGAADAAEATSAGQVSSAEAATPSRAGAAEVASGMEFAAAVTLQTRGLQQRRRRRQQRLGRAEQRQAGTRGCSRGARSSFAGGSVVTAGFGVFNGVACNGGSGYAAGLTVGRSSCSTGRSRDKQGGGGCSSGTRNSFAGGSVVFPSSWAAGADCRHRRC